MKQRRSLRKHGSSKLYYRGSVGAFDTSAYRTAESLLALEPRFLFDAAGVATGAEIAVDTVTQAQADSFGSEIQSNHLDATALMSALADHSPSTTQREIIFVDISVKGYERLLEGISSGIEVSLLDSKRDGIEWLPTRTSPSA